MDQMDGDHSTRETSKSERQRGGWRTLFVARGEEDGAGVVADEALGDAGAAEVGGCGGTLLEDGAGGEDAGGEGVAAGLGEQLVDGGEDRLAQWHGRGGGAGLGLGHGGAGHVGGGRGAAMVGAPGRHRSPPAERRGDGGLVW